MSSSSPHFKADQDELKDDVQVSFKPRNFNIVWGNDSRYWEIPAKGHTEPAKLKQVSWLEVTGSTPSLKKGTYEIMFEVKLTEDAFGWQGCPLFMMAKVGKKGKYTWKRLTVPTDTKSKTQLPSGADKFQITVENGSSGQDSQIYFGLYEVWTGKWKGGLEIYGAKVNKI